MEIKKVEWTYKGRLSNSKCPPTGIVAIQLAPEIILSLPFWSRHAESAVPTGYYNLGAVPAHQSIHVHISMAHAQLAFEKLGELRKVHYRNKRLRKVGSN